jgi:hypothetical protein
LQNRPVADAAAGLRLFVRRGSLIPPQPVKVATAAEEI